MIEEPTRPAVSHERRENKEKRRPVRNDDVEQTFAVNLLKRLAEIGLDFDGGAGPL
jgi:hypothetical protein